MAVSCPCLMYFTGVSWPHWIEPSLLMMASKLFQFCLVDLPLSRLSLWIFTAHSLPTNAHSPFLPLFSFSLPRPPTTRSVLSTYCSLCLELPTLDSIPPPHDNLPAFINLISINLPVSCRIHLLCGVFVVFPSPVFCSLSPPCWLCDNSGGTLPTSPTSISEGKNACLFTVISPSP